MAALLDYGLPTFPMCLDIAFPNLRLSLNNLGVLRRLTFFRGGIFILNYPIDVSGDAITGRGIAWC